MVWIRTWKAFLACIALGALFVGCGESSEIPELAPVTGRVTKGGKPVEGARVTFQPETGPSSGGITDAEGRFELYYSADQKGAVPGKHTVKISKMSGEAGDETIPAKFNENSTLSKEVTKSGLNDFDLKI